MKYHLTGFTASALLHASLLLLAMPWLLWQDKLSKVDEPQPVQLSLAQFQPVPQPTPAEIPVSKPEPPVPPKPEPPPKPKAEPPKPTNKPKPVPKPKTPAAAKPTPKPAQHAHQHEHVMPQPARPPAPAAPAVAARPQPARTAPAQQANNKAAEAAYRARLQAMIASRKRYPPQAADNEAEGTVMVAFTVSANGRISGTRVARSSGNSWLDKAALQAVNAVSGALPFPPEIHKQQWAFSLAVQYQLE